MNSTLNKPPLLAAANVTIHASRLESLGSRDIERMVRELLSRHGVQQTFDVSGRVVLDQTLARVLGIVLGHMPEGGDRPRAKFAAARLVEIAVTPRAVAGPVRRAQVYEAVSLLPFSREGLVQVAGTTEVDFSAAASSLSSASRKFAATLAIPRAAYDRFGCRSRTPEEVALCFGTTTELVAIRRRMFDSDN